MGKIFNKGLTEEDKKEGVLETQKRIEDEIEKQLKVIEDQKEVQAKISSKNKIKPPLLKSIYSQEVKDGRIDNNEAKRIFKTLEYMEGSKIDYCKLVYRSGDNEYFDFTRFGPLSNFYLKLINANIGINVAKLNMKEFKKEINRLEKRKQRNSYTKQIKKIFRKLRNIV